MEKKYAVYYSGIYSTVGNRRNAEEKAKSLAGKGKKAWVLESVGMFQVPELSPQYFETKDEPVEAMLPKRDDDFEND